MHKLPVPRQAEHHTSPQGCTWNKSIASKLYNCNMKKIIGHIEIIESYHVRSNLPNLRCSLGPCWLKHLARMEFSHGKICPCPGFPVEQTPLRFCKGDSSPNSFCLWLRVFLRRLVSVPNWVTEMEPWKPNRTDAVLDAVKSSGQIELLCVPLVANLALWEMAFD